MQGLMEHLGTPIESLGMIQPDIPSIQLPPESLRNAVEYILNADMAAYVSAIIGQELDDALELIYLFTGKRDFALRIPLPFENAKIDSICDLTVAASFYEREAREMLGITFDGLDQPENLLLPTDAITTPLRTTSKSKEE